MHALLIHSCWSTFALCKHYMPPQAHRSIWLCGNQLKVARCNPVGKSHTWLSLYSFMSVLADIYAESPAGFAPIALEELFNASAPSSSPPMLNKVLVATTGTLPTGAGGQTSFCAHTSGMHHCTDCSLCILASIMCPNVIKDLSVLTVNVRPESGVQLAIAGLHAKIVAFQSVFCLWYMHAVTCPSSLVCIQISMVHFSLAEVTARLRDRCIVHISCCLLWI